MTYNRKLAQGALEKGLIDAETQEFINKNVRSNNKGRKRKKDDDDSRHLPIGPFEGFFFEFSLDKYLEQEEEK